MNLFCIMVLYIYRMAEWKQNRPGRATLEPCYLFRIWHSASWTVDSTNVLQIPDLMHGRSTSLFSHVKRVLFALACNDIASVTVDNVDILQILDLICTNLTSLLLHLEWVLFAPAQAPAGLQQPIQHWLSLGTIWKDCRKFPATGSCCHTSRTICTATHFELEAWSNIWDCSIWPINQFSLVISVNYRFSHFIRPLIAYMIDNW